MHVDNKCTVFKLDMCRIFGTRLKGLLRPVVLAKGHCQPLARKEKIKPTYPARG
jgi:hypothetical protein